MYGTLGIIHAISNANSGKKKTFMLFIHRHISHAPNRLPRAVCVQRILSEMIFKIFEFFYCKCIASDVCVDMRDIHLRAIRSKTLAHKHKHRPHIRDMLIVGDFTLE